MNKQSFLQQIENSRNCDSLLLSMAVSRGVGKAKSDIVSLKKICALVIAAMLVALVLATMSRTPLRTFMADYFSYRSEFLLNAADIESRGVNSLGDLLEYWRNT